ncbi:adenosine deaminase [Polynucleobacter sp. Ross1-W9]|uniref:adenosine deaminase family protein n=1 Tax=Polynucleobacter parvulilacunae TaxID=1855631 RepID=UPI001C0C3E8F|nr:adenosine deaminase [Polynucleobacter parvulilacunae]
MKKLAIHTFNFLTLLCLSLAVSAQSSNPAARWFDAHKERPQMVRQFLQLMPKGADVHTHLSGAVYAETYLDIAKKENYCLDDDTYKISASPCKEGSGDFSAKQLAKVEREKAIDRYSARNIEFANRPGHDHFFESFGLFKAISSNNDYQAIMIAEVANRAASQNIQLLELMISIQSKGIKRLGADMKWGVNQNFQEGRQWMLQNGLGNLVEAGKKDLDDIEAASRKLMNCGTAMAQGGCDVKVRFLVQTTRNGAPNQVFAQLTYAFELAKADPRVLGINLVSPEDTPNALRDYSLQMSMIQYLSGISPQVKIALHAGELAFGDVPPQNLRNHITDAVKIAGASRIGHGVDIGYEDGAIETLKYMKQKGVAVEICLTSNDVILNVKGKDSPLKDYMAAGVPVILASDDEGISRIDLTNEYVRAAVEQGLSYAQLKQISRNSLTWSFLPGSNLWGIPEKAQLVAPCRSDTPGSEKVSGGCSQFLASSEKAAAQWHLEAALQAFEKLPEWTSK